MPTWLEGAHGASRAPWPPGQWEGLPEWGLGSRGDPRINTQNCTLGDVSLQAGEPWPLLGCFTAAQTPQSWGVTRPRKQEPGRGHNGVCVSPREGEQKLGGQWRTQNVHKQPALQPLPPWQAQNVVLAGGGQKANPGLTELASRPSLRVLAPCAREQMVRPLIPHCLRGPGTPATEGQGLSVGEAEAGGQVILGQAGLGCQRKRWRDSGGHKAHLPLAPGLSSAQ